MIELWRLSFPIGILEDGGDTIPATSSCRTFLSHGTAVPPFVLRSATCLYIVKQIMTLQSALYIAFGKRSDCSVAGAEPLFYKSR